MSVEPAPRPLTFPLYPIPAKAALRRPMQLPDYLPARMLNEFVYCPRLFFYEWVEGVFRHSNDTVDGTVPGITAEAFEALAAEAKAGCPISKALAGVPSITVTATLL